MILQNRKLDTFHQRQPFWPYTTEMFWQGRPDTETTVLDQHFTYCQLHWPRKYDKCFVLLAEFRGCILYTCFYRLINILLQGRIAKVAVPYWWRSYGSSCDGWLAKYRLWLGLDQKSCVLCHTRSGYRGDMQLLLKWEVNTRIVSRCT